MVNHEMNESGYVPKKEIRQLPDRSDLTELYYETNRGYQKGAVNYDGPGSQISHAQYIQFINKNFAIIGLLFPLPITILFLLYDIFSDTDFAKSSSIFFMLSMLLIGIISIPIFIVSYRKIRNILEKLGFGFLYFFVYLILCMGLIYAPAFLAGTLLDNLVLTHLATYLIVAFFCIATTKILLVALGDEQVNYRIKSVLRGIPLAICLVIAVIFSYFLL